MHGTGQHGLGHGLGQHGLGAHGLGQGSQQGFLSQQQLVNTKAVTVNATADDTNPISFFIKNSYCFCCFEVKRIFFVSYLAFFSSLSHNWIGCSSALPITKKDLPFLDTRCQIISPVEFLFI